MHERECSDHTRFLDHVLHYGNGAGVKTPGVRLLHASAGIACFAAFAMGMADVQATGVAVIKEWDFHRDSTARPVVYLRIIDSHGPYLRLVTRRGNIDIQRSKLANHVEVPDSVPAHIMEENDISSLRMQLAAIREFSIRYPLSAGLLNPLATALAGHIARFDAGHVRFEGSWMARNELDSLLTIRRHEARLARKREIEHVIFSEAQEERGLVMRNGEWVSEAELRERPPSARTELSDTLWPLLNSNIEGARMALSNLAFLAARQTGTAKVRTERLHAVIRKLFLAEFRLSRQIIARTAAMADAAIHERYAAEALKPNPFGTVRTDMARESRAKAEEIKSRASDELDACRAELLSQLRESDIVTDDLYQLREHRAALILGETVRSVASRNFSSGQFKSSIPEENLSAIRAEISSRK